MSNAVIVKPLPLVLVTASSSALGHDPAYVGNDHMGVVWKSGGGGASQTLLVDMGGDVAADALLLLGCTGANAGWTLRVQAATAAQGPSFTAGFWDSGDMPFLAGEIMPKTGRGRALWLAPTGMGPSPSRYWRVTIGGLAGAPAVVARLVLGLAMRLERNFQFGGAFGIRDLSQVDFSARGVLLRRRGVKLRSIALTFGNVRKDEVEAKVNPLIEEVGNSEPVAAITDPDPDAQRQNRIWFGPIVGDLGTVWAKPGGFEWRVGLVSLNA